jgi:lysophospholipase L1-like esterase
MMEVVMKLRQHLRAATVIFVKSIKIYHRAVLSILRKRQLSLTRAISNLFCGVAAFGALIVSGAVARDRKDDLSGSRQRDRLFVGNRSMMLSQAKGGGGPNNNDAQFTHGESYYVYRNGPVAVCNLQLTFANFALGPDEHSVAVQNPITIESSISIAGQLPRRISFAGGSIVRPTIETEGTIVSDIVPVYIPPNSAFAIRTGVFVVPGGTWPVGFSNYSKTDNAVASHDATSQVMSPHVSVAVPSGGVGNQLGYGPIAVTGLYNKPDIVIAALGDSLTTGNTGAGNGNGEGDRGVLPYGFADAPGGRVAYSKLARDSAYLTAFTNPLRAGERLRELRYATHVVVWLGTNDMGAHSLADLESRLKFVWGKARENNRYVIAVTLPPRTLASDRSATIDSQAPLKGWEVGGKRDQLNAWIKSQVGINVDDVLDLNAIWESKNHHGLWASGYSADGTHPNEVGMQKAKSTVAEAAGRWRAKYNALESPISAKSLCH